MLSNPYLNVATAAARALGGRFVVKNGFKLVTVSDSAVTAPCAKPVGWLTNVQVYWVLSRS